MPWDIPIRQHLDEIQAEMESVVKDAARTAIRSLVAYTPVRTGQLRGGWQPAINSDPPFMRVGDDPAGGITIAFTDAVVEKFRLGDVLNIVNYTPHGIYINDGTSRIEPRRMVERAADDVASQLGGA